MSKKWKYPTKPFLHDYGRLVVRGLAPRTYVGVRLFHDGGFRSIRGENTERVCTQYDAIISGEFKERAGLRKYDSPGRDKKHETPEARKKRRVTKGEGLEATLRLQTYWLTRKWA